MIAYDSINTPIGRLWIAMSERGLCLIAFDQPKAEVQAHLARWHREEPRHDASLVLSATRQLEEYFSGQRKTFDLPLDLTSVPPFYRHVLLCCLSIPYGETRTYGELAVMAGRPGAARAVGNAMACNPLPIVVPCHRVTKRDGSLGRYGGGMAMKRWLLKWEGACPSSHSRNVL